MISNSTSLLDAATEIIEHISTQNKTIQESIENNFNHMNQEMIGFKK